MLKSLELKATWPKVARQDDPVSATFADLCVSVGDDIATTYVDLDNGSEFKSVEQPMLYLAEWLVENWWSLLWEPEKFDDGERKVDATFPSRHSIAYAGHGFPLPDLSIVPAGDDFRVFLRPYVSEHAQVRFTKDISAQATRSGIESVLAEFIDAVSARIRDDAPLKADWNLIKSTSEGAAQFCRLKGALGLSPYLPHMKIEAALDKASDSMTAQQLLDLCQTATANDFLRTAHVSSLVNGILDSDAKDIDLTPLADLRMPSDIRSAPAFKRGYTAAQALREGLGIAESDVSGGTRVFENLQIDWKSGSRIDLKGFSSPVSGALHQSKGHGRIALVHEASSSRRFAAARATFFFWAKGDHERRLLTNAVTREQQASRAFAAELLVPQNVVRSHARKSRISTDQIDAIAEEAMVSPEVVRHQATNGGLTIAF